MRSTLLYASLTTILGGTVYCMTPITRAESHSASTHHVADDRAIAWRPSELPAAAVLGLTDAETHAGHVSADCRSCHRGDLRVAAPKRLASAEVETSTMPAPSLTAGMTRESVRALLGEPLTIEQDGTRWNYAARTVIFRNDVVTGWVDADAAALAMNQRGVDEMSSQSREPQFAGRFANLGPETAPRASRSARETDRRFDVLSRLRASRSTTNTTFRQPEWLRSFGRSLDRNHEENRRREARLANGRRG